MNLYVTSDFFDKIHHSIIIGRKTDVNTLSTSDLCPMIDIGIFTNIYH